jgi:AcrR family transcriptional regulator
MTTMTAARSPLTPAGPPGRTHGDRTRPGLRERKKTRTREAIRAATYGLIEELGYDATTIERIAERAEVSPSTVLRHFPVKEDIVLTDDHDRPLLADLATRPAGEPWPDSLRHVLRGAVRRAMAEQPEVTLLRAGWRSRCPRCAPGCFRACGPPAAGSPRRSPRAPASIRTAWRCASTRCP